MVNLAGYRRYAVYWAPPENSALARFGSAWLGWDPAAARAVAQPDVAGLAAATAVPRRYGFHATLKPPFALAKGATPEMLDTAIAGLAARLPPVIGAPLALDRGLGFLALRPGAPCPALDALAAAAVRDLDPLRAPLGPAEIARRRETGLTPAQETNLMRWGYPYVLGAFRFHLTLSGKVTAAEAQPLAKAAAAFFGPLLDDPLQVSDLCLFGDPGEGCNFRLLNRYPLTG